jgi:hypothetical protein
LRGDDAGGFEQRPKLGRGILDELLPGDHGAVGVFEV